MARGSSGVGCGVVEANSAVGIAVGSAPNLVSRSSLSSGRFRSTAPAKHLVPTGDEV